MYAFPFNMEVLLLAGEKMKTTKAVGQHNLLPDTDKNTVGVAPNDPATNVSEFPLTLERVLRVKLRI